MPYLDLSDTAATSPQFPTHDLVVSSRWIMDVEGGGSYGQYDRLVRTGYASKSKRKLQEIKHDHDDPRGTFKGPVVGFIPQIGS